MSNQAPPWSHRSYLKKGTSTSPQRQATHEALTAKVAAIDCATCERRLATGEPYGPPHTSSTKGHRPHCSCDGCY